MSHRREDMFIGLGAIVFVLLVFASWGTHVIACIKASAWFLLLFGIFVPPIGWIHGLAVWFGWL
jgi:uncharacterized membrane protein YGL010W